jgi:hypothetical protein
MVLKTASRGARIGGGLVPFPLIAWGAAAIWFDGPAERWLAALLAAAFALAAAAALALLRSTMHAMVAVLALFCLVLAWWLSIPATNDADWQPDVARTASAGIEGNILTIRNVRDFAYRSETDYTPRWETRRYDLSQLRGADMFLSYWGPRLIAHTIMSWEFADGRHLAISIETRKKKGQEYSAVLGFFRQYEIYYVVADERDVVGLRAKFRGENLYLYRLKAPAAQARAMLLDYLKEVNRLDTRPEWYNALTHNCTTTIRHHAQDVGAGRAFDWRILANGHIDELGYERGQIDTSLPFPELRRRSDITARAKAAYPGGQPGFSRIIRENLPGGHPPP